MSKCSNCINEFNTCEKINVIFAIDIDPELKGEDANTVVDCDSFEPRNKNGKIKNKVQWD